jgi:hypothetical protein
MNFLDICVGLGLIEKIKKSVIHKFLGTLVHVVS